MNLVLTTPAPPPPLTNSPPIDPFVIPYCVVLKKSQCLLIQYNKIATGGNDPTITKAMRFSQYVKNAPGCPRVSGYT